ncbi:Fic family protein [Erysipelatoclostridium ramosum]|uniref:Fic family protein n=1 Tax=Thomasclavelia ramosa TaxID=1547 RepID=A0AB35IM12_9FIRM|nr:Fic family protein [Thomasclavelia ramosa]MDB7084693.1 Fic family protein [Thomasclavelia ramosa]
MTDNSKKIIKMWKRKNIRTAFELDNALENFQVLFAYNSNHIEMPEVTYHDTREIFENGKVTNFRGDIKNLFAIQNQKTCYLYLRNRIVKKEKLSVDLIKEIHHELVKGTYDERRFERGERPGEFKKHDYVTGKNEVGSYPNEVEGDIRELVTEINEIEINEDNCFMVAAYFHARFENIHPFADGNGRVGRTLLNYLNMINNIPPVIVYDEDKKYYYECLEKYDTDDDISSLEEFFEYELERTWQRELLEIKKNTSHKKLSDTMENTVDRLKTEEK